MRRTLLVHAGIGAAFFVAGVLVGVILFFRPSERDVPLPRVTVAGVPIRYGEPLHPQLTRIGSAYLRSEVVLEDGDFELTVRRRDLGAFVDYRALERRVSYVVGHRADLDAFLRAHRGSSLGDVALGLPVRLDSQAALESVLSIKYEYDRRPSAARLDMANRTVLPHLVGRTMSIDETLHNLEAGLAAGAARVAIGRIEEQPLTRTSDIESIDISTVISWFETPYCLMKRCLDRNANLELGGKILDGTIIGPGETFDFNEALGERTESRGFRPAPTIESGELVPTPGGGTCQTASTLHAAAFFAGLDILERRQHSRPSGYILLGLDSTVTWPNINLRIRNPFDFPVVIHYVVADGTMRVEILGGKRPRMVHFVRRVTQKTPYEEQVVEMPDWPAGVQVIQQLGIDGFRVRRYRVVWEGTRAWREVTEDVYPATPQVTAIGTNKSMPAKGFVPPTGDTHSPYQADLRIKYYLDWNGEFQKIIANW